MKDALKKIAKPKPKAAKPRKAKKEAGLSREQILARARASVEKKAEAPGTVMNADPDWRYVWFCNDPAEPTMNASRARQLRDMFAAQGYQACNGPMAEAEGPEYVAGVFMAEIWKIPRDIYNEVIFAAKKLAAEKRAAGLSG